MRFLSRITLVTITCFVLFGCSLENNGAMILKEDDASDDSATVETEGDDEITELFQPEKEWKTIKKGQSIPPGLHVRINLQTGLKEAKILDEEESSIKPRQTFDYNELKEAMKNIKVEDLGNNEDLAKIKKKFRSMDSLKEEFNKLNMNIETDYEIMTKLLKRFQNVSLTDDERIVILTDLEYHLHQYDNAVNFIRKEMNGLELLLPLLNSTNCDIRSAAAHVLGSAMQSNGKVQVAVLKSNVLMQFIRMIELDQSTKVKNKVMYALSGLVRQFPYAQLQLIRSGALKTFTTIFDDKKGHEGKLKLKAISLLLDLIHEKEAFPDSSNISDVEKQKREQYEKIDIKGEIINLGFCRFIPTLLPSEDHDTREIAVKAMLNLYSRCKNDFVKIATTLEELKLEYKNLSDNAKLESDYEGEDEYFTMLYNKISSLLVKFQTNYHSEL